MQNTSTPYWSWFIFADNSPSPFSRPPPPQLELTHNEECNADKRKAARDELVPIEVLHNECYEDVKQWNIAGLRKSDMFRLLQDRFAPLKLGEDGRRKVCSTFDWLVNLIDIKKYVWGDIVSREIISPEEENPTRKPYLEKEYSGEIISQRKNIPREGESWRSIILRETISYILEKKYPRERISQRKIILEETISWQEKECPKRTNVLEI